MGQLIVLPKHWWEDTGPNGRKRDISQTTLEPPLGSGPYKVKSFQQGQYVTYERRSDYWAKDLPVNRGRFNYDEVKKRKNLEQNIELKPGDTIIVP